MDQMQSDRAIELRLVLRVEPWRWSDRQLPPELTIDDYVGWDAYFADCLADAGVTGVKPVFPGCSFADAFAIIENEFMLRIIEEELETSRILELQHADGGQYDLNDVSPLEGGCVMHDGDELLIVPNCCGELVDLDNWKAALRERPFDGTVWIGHPEAGISFLGDEVTLRPRIRRRADPNHPAQTIGRA